MEDIRGIITTLLQMNKDLTDKVVELSQELARVKAPVEYPVMQSSPIPLHTPESEEDAQFAFNTGQIDKPELENILKELQFYNSEVVIPSG